MKKVDKFFWLNNLMWIPIAVATWFTVMDGCPFIAASLTKILSDEAADTKMSLFTVNFQVLLVGVATLVVLVLIKGYFSKKEKDLNDLEVQYHINRCAPKKKRL